MFTKSAQQHLQLPASEMLFTISGVNHRETPIELRERFAVSREHYARLLEEVLGHPGIEEAVLLSTCNRTEVVTAGGCSSPGSVQEHIEEVLSGASGVSTEEFNSGLYHLKQGDAVCHLFRVAAGLDSMVIGEPQVLGQLKTAYEEASSCGATKELLNRLFHRAFGVAKAVRTQTGIGRSAVSVSYAAKELASQIFGDLSEAAVLMIGAGDTGELALKHFRAAGCERFFVANRTLQKAAGLAESFSALALELRLVADVLPEADIVVGACGLLPNDPPLVTAADVQRSLKKRRGRPQFLIDLAVPRNVDPEVDSLADAFLYNVDDLQQVVERNLDARAVEVQRAELIVEEQVRKFESWLESRCHFPAIRAARERAARLQQGEAEKTLRRLKRQGFSDEECRRIASALDDYSQALIGKLLHRPLTTLRERGAAEPGLASAFSEFFVDEDRPVPPKIVRLRTDK